MDKDLKLSIIYGIIGRIATLANQILSVPLIIILIGLDSFNQYTILIASISWFATLGGSLIPTLVGDVTRANAQSDIILVSKHVTNVLITLSIFFILCSIIFVLLYWLPERNLVVVFLLSIGILLLSVSDNIRQGFHETYKNSWFNGFSNLFSVIFLYIAYKLELKLDIAYVSLIMLGSTLFFKLLNMIFINKKLCLSFTLFDYKYCIRLVKSARFFVLISLSFYLSTGALLTIVNKYSFHNITYVIMLQKLTLTLMGLLIMLRNPLWSIIAKEMYENNSDKVYFQYKKYLMSVILFLPVSSALVYYFSPLIISVWTNEEVLVQSSYMIEFSIYFSLQFLLYFNSIFYYGLEIFNKISKLLLIESLLVCTFAYLLFVNNCELKFLYIALSCSSFLLNLTIIKNISVRLRM